MLNIIGAGRVGRTLLRLLGESVQHIASGRLASARAAVAEAGHGHAVALDDMSAAEVWVLAVPDDQIANAAQSLAERDMPPAIAIHCSGFHRADVMAPLREKGWSVASAHPNLSFADPKQAAKNFPGTYVGVEGDGPATKVAHELFASIGAQTFPVVSENKALYHAAAVISNNFTTVLQAIAHQVWAEAGVPEDVATALGNDLLSTATRNIAKLGPAEALTGPAARGDHAVIATEVQSLTDWNGAVGELYAELSAMAERLKQDGAPVAPKNT